jgi:hypothetical protein
MLENEYPNPSGFKGSHVTGISFWKIPEWREGKQ